MIQLVEKRFLSFWRSINYHGINLLILPILLTTPILAEPIVESLDSQLLLNWGSLRLQFSGKAALEQESQPKVSEQKIQGLSALENQAWQDGLAKIDKNIQKLFKEKYTSFLKDKNQLDAAALQAFHKLSSNVFEISSKYETSPSKKTGMVLEIKLGSLLVNAFHPNFMTFQERSNDTQNTKSESNLEKSGILIELEQDSSPMPLYTIVNEKGDVLFTPQEVYRDSFQKNMMGTWYKNASSSEIKKTVGSTPIKIRAKISEPQKLVISQSQWVGSKLNENRDLLKNSKIAFSLGSSKI